MRKTYEELKRQEVKRLQLKEKCWKAEDFLLDKLAQQDLTEQEMDKIYKDLKKVRAELKNL